MVSYVIRPVGLCDQTLLWCWRNDPVTREMARIPDIITQNIHAAQLTSLLSAPDCRLMLAETDANAVAVGYLCMRGHDRAEIGININPAFRGLKLAAGLITAFTETPRPDLGYRTVLAEVKQINLPSRRAFIRAGYHEDAIANGIVYFSRDMTGGSALAGMALAGLRHRKA